MVMKIGRDAYQETGVTQMDRRLCFTRNQIKGGAWISSRGGYLRRAHSHRRPQRGYHPVLSSIRGEKTPRLKGFLF